MKKIVIIGSQGQLASELRLLQSEFSYLELHFFGKEEINIQDKADLALKIKSINPQFIINCAAYTAVDKAESDEQTAFDINEKGVQNLAVVSKELGVFLIHISTDFVYDGKKSTPYKENDTVHPLSVYGMSKLKGEEVIENSGVRFIIIRTSWLYSTFGNNFVKTMMRLGKEKESINVVSDQRGSPTYARDLAQFILKNLDRFSFYENQIYHYSNEGEATWFEFAQEIMILAHLPCRVFPIPSSEYPTPAIRPAYSVMDKTKIKEDFKIQIPHWKESLKKCIEQM